MHVNELESRVLLSVLNFCSTGDSSGNLGRFRKVFTDAQELELVSHLKELDDSFYGLTLFQLRRLAYTFAERNNIDHPFNKNSQLAGEDWAFKFRDRHNLSLRTPQQTSIARMMGMNKTQVLTYLFKV